MSIETGSSILLFYLFFSEGQVPCGTEMRVQNSTEKEMNTSFCPSTNPQKTTICKALEFNNQFAIGGLAKNIVKEKNENL